MTDAEMVAFQQACGSEEPLVLEIAAGNSAPVRKVFEQPFVLIGRDQRSDLHLPDKPVNTHHAFLQRIGGQVFCVDLDSRSGTHWPRGARRADWLQPRAALRIGPYHLRAVPDAAALTADPPTWNPLETCPADLQAGPQLALECLNGRTRKPYWPVDRILTLIGTASGCRFRLRSKIIAPFHGYLLATPHGVWLVDLLSAGGILHNGTPVRFAALKVGDQLLLGDYLVRLHDTSKPTAFGLAPQPVASEPAIPAAPLKVFPGPLTETPGHNENSLLPMMNQFAAMQQQMFDQFHQTMMAMVQMFGSVHKEHLAVVRQEIATVENLTRELAEVKETLARTPVTTADLLAQAPEPDAQPALADSSPVKAPAKPHPRANEPVQSPEQVHAWLNRRLETIQQERQSHWQKILGLLTGGGE